jgi:hypothetical protein
MVKKAEYLAIIAHAGQINNAEVAFIKRLRFVVCQND